MKHKTAKGETAGILAVIHNLEHQQELVLDRIARLSEHRPTRRHARQDAVNRHILDTLHIEDEVLSRLISRYRRWLQTEDGSPRP
jgi:hypothetical protein